MSTPTLITVAPTGAEHDKVDLPQLPTTVTDLVETARRCEAAGAGMIHLHLRDAEHRPSLDLGLLREAVVAVREATDLVVQLSTGGSVHDSAEARVRVLEADPDSCSLTCGTLNFGDDVFMNPFSLMSRLYVEAQEREIVPEMEIFDVGQIASMSRLVERHGMPSGGRLHVDLVLGVPGGLPATPQALMAAVTALPPEVTSWCATGLGRAHLPVLAMTLGAGGHLRVGLEDNVMLGPGRPVRHNDELVARAAQVAELLQRPAMSTTQARDLLGVKDRRAR